MNEPDIEQKPEEAQPEIDRYLDEVVAKGFAVSLLGRFSAFLRGLALGVGAIVAAFFTSLSWGVTGSMWGFWAPWGVALLVTACAAMGTLTLGLWALVNFAIVATGREPLQHRLAREKF